MKSMATTTFLVHGTHCSSCKTLIEMALQDLPGVTSAEVDLETEEVTIASEHPISQDTIRQEIEELGGYTVEFPEDHQD